MIVTEEEAKTKRCQESFGPTLTITNVVPGGLHASPLHCLGSACMAWRWSWQGETPVHLCTDFGTTPLGYCGKAGKP